MNNKIISLVINGVIAVLCLVGVYFVLKAMQTETDPETIQSVTDTAAVGKSVSFSLALIYGAIGLIAVFTIWAIIVNPKRFITAFIAIAVFAAIVLVGYSIATVETSGPVVRLAYATEDWIKWSDIGIKVTYILAGLAIALIIVQMIRNVSNFFSK